MYQYHRLSNSYGPVLTNAGPGGGSTGTPTLVGGPMEMTAEAHVEHETVGTWS